MVRDDFVDLINSDRSGGELPEDEGTLATVIKDDELTFGDDRATVGEKKVIESESFILKLYEKDGIVDSIEIECRCGRTARIQLEYKKPGVEGDVEVVDVASEAPPEPEIVENSDESIAVESVETDDIQSEDVKEAEASTEEPLSNSDQSSDTEETDEFQEGLQTSVISSQNDEEKPKIIEPVEKKPDDADNSQ